MSSLVTHYSALEQNITVYPIQRRYIETFAQCTWPGTAPRYIHGQSGLVMVMVSAVSLRY